jgi:hypothetical protein
MWTEWNQQPRQQQAETEQMAALQAESDRQRDNLTGVWMAFYRDGSLVMPFKTEIEALRFAKGNGLDVEFVPYGTDVFA